MIYEILKKKQITEDIVTKWYQTQIQNLEKRNSEQTADTVTVIWDGIRYDDLEAPQLIIEFSDDGINPVMARNQKIDTISNLEDVSSYIITKPLNYIRFKVLKNDCSEGHISILINYR